MVGRWGMSDVIGPVAVITDNGGYSLTDASPATQQLVDEEVRHLIERSHGGSLS
jgi:cell division protease FtsH